MPSLGACRHTATAVVRVAKCEKMQGRVGQGRAGSGVNWVRDWGAMSKMWARDGSRRRATDEHRGAGRVAVDVFSRRRGMGAYRGTYHMMSHKRHGRAVP